MPESSIRRQRRIGVQPGHLRTGLAAAPVLHLLLAILVLGAIAIGLSKPKYNGDAAEYALMAIAIAGHASPELRRGDLDVARRVLPEYGWLYQQVDNAWAGAGNLPSGLLADNRGQTRAIHFFGYSALAALPFSIARALGSDPMRCFMWVDLACLMVLALAAHAYFGSARRAAAAAALFLLTVGIPYWNWTSPEFSCAALALAALLCMGASAFVAGGILAGLAAMQNPPIALLLLFGPAIVLAEQTSGGARAALIFLSRHWSGIVLGGVLGGALACWPVVISLQVFDSWNVIATGATDQRLVSLQRLASYYLDWN